MRNAACKLVEQARKLGMEVNCDGEEEEEEGAGKATQAANRRRFAGACCAGDRDRENKEHGKMEGKDINGRDQAPAERKKRESLSASSEGMLTMTLGPALPSLERPGTICRLLSR